MSEMSLGMYLQCRKNLSHGETMEVQKMMDEFKNDPWKPFKETIYVTILMVLLIIISVVVLPAIFIIAVRLLS